MNAHFREALGAGAHPNVEFRLAQYAVDTTAGARAVRIDGELTIAGRTRPIVSHAVVTQDSAAQWHVTGAQALDVRDYGIVPPRRFAGLLRVRSRVVVHFDVVTPP